MSKFALMRSVGDSRLHVLCEAGEFEKAPDFLRHQGPWDGMGEGEVDTLRLHYRLLLAEQRFVVLYRRMLTSEALSSRASAIDSVEGLRSVL